MIAHGGVEALPTLSRLWFMRSASSNIGSIDLSQDVFSGLRVERRASSTMTQTSLSKIVGIGAPPLNYDNSGCSETASSNLKGMLWRCDRIDDT
jgi:hypothetical protein